MDIGAVQFGVALAMGISLAVTAGFRSCLPMLAIGIGARMGWLPINHDYDWLGDWPALTAFGLATVLESLADKWPGLDHALHAVVTLVAPVAGTIAVSSIVPIQDPFIQTALGIIAGGAPSTLVHLTRATTRPVATAATFGIGNFFISIGEDIVALGGVAAAFLAPFVGAIIGVFILIGCFFVLRAAKRFIGRMLSDKWTKAPQPNSGTNFTREALLDNELEARQKGAQ
jgi:hypothetical protein